MTYITVPGASALKPGEMKKFHVTETDILVANVNGTFYSISNKCTHMGGSLADGLLDGSLVKCPRHGAQFDVTTGKCVGPATMLFIKKNPDDIQSYPTQLENGNVIIQL